MFVCRVAKYEYIYLSSVQPWVGLVTRVCCVTIPNQQLRVISRVCVVWITDIFFTRAKEGLEVSENVVTWGFPRWLWSCSLTTPWSWSWWLKIVAWLQSTSCLCAWNTTVKLSSLHNCNLLWIKIRGKQSACICLILSTSLKTFRKAGFLARYLRVHACFSSGVQVPIPAWSIGDRRDSGW